MTLPLSLIINNQLIYSKSKIKFLGVVFYKKLTYKKYIAKVLKKQIIAALNLKKLQTYTKKVLNNYLSPLLFL